MAQQPAGKHTVMDPTAVALSSVYAQAMLDLVADNQQAEEIAQQLLEISALFEQQDGAEELLSSEVLSEHHRMRVVHDIFSGRCDERIEAFLSVLARKGRLMLLRVVCARFRQLLNEREGKVEVTVATAVEMNQAMRQKLLAAVETLAGNHPLLTTKVDPALLGGVVVTVGDKVYDASTATELKRMRRELTESLMSRAGKAAVG